MHLGRPVLVVPYPLLNESHQGCDVVELSLL